MLLFSEGEKSMHYILMCRSMTSAQKAVRLLQKAGIYASVAKAPQSANPGGCTYGAKVADRNVYAAAGILEKAGVKVEKILALEGGMAREVQL